MNKKLFLVLGDQLFKTNKDLRDVDFVMVESREICTRFNYHKQKLTFILACMREHRDFLVGKNHKVDYYELKEQKSFEDVLKSYPTLTRESVLAAMAYAAALARDRTVDMASAGSI